ncbi:TetR/AcrR family transcriptional regulator [Methylobacterium nodulans]|uniref:Transcriptional regulator, TetR family n=1 Tax=Methylobacterium nodulans (strain LMG 21967 / CNCM I-2342 / ORS 2060) TaxID=460265 RepID=B8INL6_METNO|nr:TetR/AcrR family transcriptional regulator [Methylobacterium nodulans]ACL56542.1 transcriptional regulator, TetR family [Methylobacterium nodulans ORS 2060]
MSRAAVKPRRTQEQRTAETRARLIAATLDLLMERGYARTTTAEIAERAGVTRGALNHHFTGKDDLVVHSVEHQLRTSTGEIRALAELVRNGSLALPGFIDRLWEMFSGRLFLITLEHVTEARHNAALREALVPVVREFHAALDATWRDLFRGNDAPDREVETALNATLCLLRGMGVQSILRHDPVYYRRLADYWTAMLSGRPGIAPAGP